MYSVYQIKRNEDWDIILKLSDGQKDISFCGRNVYWRLIKEDNVLYSSNELSENQNLFDLMNEATWYEQIKTPLCFEGIEKIRSCDWMIKLHNGYIIDVLARSDKAELSCLDKNGD